MKKKFSAQIEGIRKKVESKFENAIHLTIIEMGEFIIDELSPVRTGRFQSNWKASVGQMDVDYDYEIVDADASRMSLVLAAEKLEAGEKFYFTESVPYAVRLDNGWSSQAPNGIIGPAIENFYSKLDANISAVR